MAIKSTGEIVTRWTHRSRPHAFTAGEASSHLARMVAAEPDPAAAAGRPGCELSFDPGVASKQL